MSVSDSLKEYVKELYHDGIRTVGKFIALVSLATALGFMAACSQPAPTPTPTPEIRCDRWWSGVDCKKNGQSVLLFKFEPNYQMPIGSTARINVFISPEVFVYSGAKEAVIYYSLGRDWANKGERNIFASMPVNQEIVLPFKPDKPNCFRFYLEDVDSGVSRLVSKDGTLGVANYTVGRPSTVLLKVDKYETTTYNPITIRAEIEPSPVVYGWLQIVKDDNYKPYEIHNSPFELTWIPSEGHGVYKMYVEGKGGSDCGYIQSKTNPIEIIVR